MKSLPIAIVILFLAGIGGCASSNDRAPQAGGALMMSNHAQCTVCKKNADLACVDVAVDDRTPRAVYQGKTYYFCSDDCRKDFEKNPAKYAAK
jgi:hypothetical protein